MSDTSRPTVDVLEATQKFGDQLLSTFKQTQRLALDNARAFAGALPSVPSALPDTNGLFALPDLPAATAYTFDLATELLAVQKDFAVSLANTFAAEKTVES